MPEFTKDDIRAAVMAGVINEEQAASLSTIADKRRGYREHMDGDDEPFELFRGFAEIFVTVGLAILFSGLIGLTILFGSGFGVPLVAGGLAWAFGLYFTKKRRMTLPSLALAATFSINVAFAVGLLLDAIYPEGEVLNVLLVGIAGIAATLFHFRTFKVPFSMFIIGVFGIGVIFSTVAMINPAADWDSGDFTKNLFDLRENLGTSIATLAFGLSAFIAAMWFDTKDPHRISRQSTSAFWLHILAAPALVNTFAMTFYNMGGTLGYSLTLIVLVIISVVALVIDRRSFLTAGIIYMAILLGVALNEAGAEWGPILTMLLLGSFLTALGTWWVQLRAWLMRLLPDFPYKDRLPPYAEVL